MKKLLCISFALLMSGCGAIKLNPAGTAITKNIDRPEIGVVTTVSVGDHMLEKGVIVERKALSVNQDVQSGAYKIPQGVYILWGTDDALSYYNFVGMSNGAQVAVTKAALADRFQAIRTNSDKPNELCVITVLGFAACNEANINPTTISMEANNSFQQTLIYSGRVGNRINIAYREFSKDVARPAFNNDVEYDLNVSKIIGYKGASIEIINADNSNVTYKVISNFK